MKPIPFNIPPVLGNEIQNIEKVIQSGKISGEHQFSKVCADWFVKEVNCKMAIPTPSCTSALELALLLANIGPGDEVILPSFTFTSTATAILSQFGTPVFVDSDEKTFNICPKEIKRAITSKTKAIIPVHYAGVSCDMEAILKIADEHNLIVIEDAAQCIGAKVSGKQVGFAGHMSAFSFHETKNITCGNGGMLCINDSKFTQNAEVARDKGANRQQFFRGEVDKYSWQGKGSSYFMSDLQAAYLLTQLKELGKITQHRKKMWAIYNEKLEALDLDNKLTRPKLSSQQIIDQNAHIYSILLKTSEKRVSLQRYLNENNIKASPHYVPLHSSVAGRKFGRTVGEINNCNDFSSRLLRLPLFLDLKEEQADYVVKNIFNFFKTKY